MKRSGRIILLLIVLLPSLIYFVFELSEANFTKMAYYGPKTLNTKGDTVYYSVSTPTRSILSTKCIKDSLSDGYSINKLTEKILIDTNQFPIYVAAFIQPNTKDKGYNLVGLLDYLKHKTKALKNIPFVFHSFISESYKPTGEGITEHLGLFDSIPLLKRTDFYASTYPDKKTWNEVKSAYFKGKPYYIMDHFLVLIDKQRHIRGYYDPLFDTEVKRMIQEFEHLKLRDEHANLSDKNRLEKK